MLLNKAPIREHSFRATDNRSTPPPPPVPEAEWRQSTRYADQPMDWRTRLFGIGGVTTIGLLIVVGGLFTWRTYAAPPTPATLSVFDVAPPATPPEPVSDLPPAEEVQQEKLLPKPDRPKIEPPEIQLPSDNSIPLPTPIPDPATPVEQAAAPESKLQPPAPQVSADKPTWEGLVLNALNKAKRYPRDAKSRRQQGIPFIRFVINREGKVLSSTLERRSGVPSLDREAVELPRRAQPLPKPPDDVQPGQATIELVVPVEYFLS